MDNRHKKTTFKLGFTTNASFRSFLLAGTLIVAVVDVLLISLPKRKPTLDEVERLINSLTK